jgi:membrane fusion protein (multidrug efflux system)
MERAEGTREPAAAAGLRGEPDVRPNDGAAVGAPRRPHRRRTILISAAVVLGLGGLLYYLHSRHYEETDDAQVDGNISNISPRVAGTVTAVHVGENQTVKAGDLLAEVDATDLQVGVAQARAAVAQAQAQLAAEDPSVSITETSNVAAVAGASSQMASAGAGLAVAEKEVDQLGAQLAAAEANARTAELDKTRGEELLQARAIPRAEYDRRLNAAVAAAAAVQALRQSLAAARERIGQQRAQLSATRSRLTEVKQNAPRQVETRKASVLFRQANLELARAQLQEAELNLGYARVRTPVAGVVAKKAVNVGDHVAPGQQIVAIAQTGDLWVTANFRETQLERIRPGQMAAVHVDALDTDLDAVVDSLGGATGARLSLLPPENASGNYVKVVQRIPVRLHFRPGQAGLERLRPGMSVVPKIRVVP